MRLLTIGIIIMLSPLIITAAYTIWENIYWFIHCYKHGGDYKHYGEILLCYLFVGVMLLGLFITLCAAMKL